MSEFSRVVNLLLPFCMLETERRALVEQAFHHHDDLSATLVYAGSARTFAPRLVRVLQAYGEIEAGTQAVWQLLRVLRDHLLFPDRDIKEGE
jgi:hypothetical protein